MLTLVLLVIGLLPAQGQIRSGSTFLNFTPGARYQGMAGSLTGSIDEMHALFINPAATGFLREWQWATSYTEWFANTYNVSFLYGKKIRTPWSRKSHVALGLQYQGIRAFDSTNKLDATASANDLLITGSFGNPLTFLTPNLSFGVNLKYFRSSLADFSASSLIADIGLLYKSNRFHVNNSLFDYGVFSFGVAVTQLGNGLNFISAETPLPRTVRAGAALNIGKHNGIQVKLSTDLKKVRNEKTSVSFGTEISWSYRYALRGGYNFNSNLLSKVSFGLSIRLDGRSLGGGRSIPGLNNAMRVDIAAVENNDVFSTTYRGSLNHYPIGPEKFAVTTPTDGKNLKDAPVAFQWEPSRDPDLYDDVSYALLIERMDFQTPDSLLLFNLIRNSKTKFTDFVSEIEQLASDDFFVFRLTDIPDTKSDYIKKEVTALQPGKYFWTVLAYDRDHHVRIAEKEGKNLWNFSILPDLQLTQVSFQPDSVITENTEQGKIILKIKNTGTAASLPTRFAITDSLPESDIQYTNKAEGTGSHYISISAIDLNTINPGQDTTVSFPWKTPVAGKHVLKVTLDPDNNLHEFSKTNNATEMPVFTVLKGAVKTDDAYVYDENVIAYELPFIPKVYFARNSAEINDDLTKTSLLYSPLQTLAKRLEECDDTMIRLLAFIDAAHGEPDSLIYARANAVKQKLIAYGAPADKITIPDTKKVQMLRRRTSAKNPDKFRVAEENRYVKISAYRIRHENTENTGLFNPVFISIPKTRSNIPVKFTVKLDRSVPLKKGTLYLKTQNGFSDSLALNFEKTLPDTLLWEPLQFTENTRIRQKVSYYAVIKDSLGRTFTTPKQTVALHSRIHNELKSKIILGISEFQSATPDSSIYWSNVLSKVKERLQESHIDSLEFIGHACAIGDLSFNQTLSRTRAAIFYQKLKKSDPQLFSSFRHKSVKIRIEGKGEEEPYTIKVNQKSFLAAIQKINRQDYDKIVYQLQTGKKLDPNFPFIFKAVGDKLEILSDNDTAFGRQINRRIEILFDNSELIYEEFTKN